MKELKPFNGLELSIFEGLFLDYCILGGLPEVVRDYIKKNTLFLFIFIETVFGRITNTRKR
jgi:hypothetical protein